MKILKVDFHFSLIKYGDENYMIKSTQRRFEALDYLKTKKLNLQQNNILYMLI